MDNETREAIVALARALMDTFNTFRGVIARQFPDEQAYLLERSDRIQTYIERMLDVLESEMRTTRGAVHQPRLESPD
jgi:hypothetical protein